MTHARGAALAARILLALAVILVAGCGGRQYSVRVALSEADDLQEEDPVLVDGVAVGQVERVERVNGRSIAEIVITDPDVIEKKFRTGIYRRAENRKVLFFSDEIEEGALALESGAVIPTKEGLAAIVSKYATGKTLIIVAAGALIVLLLLFVLGKIFQMAWVVVALVLALGTAWIAHPYAVPLVESIYEKSPEHSAETPAAETVDPSSGGKFLELVSNQPNPRIVAFVGVAVGSFLILSILLGTVRKKLKKP